MQLATIFSSGIVPDSPAVDDSRIKVEGFLGDGAVFLHRLNSQHPGRIAAGYSCV